MGKILFFHETKINPIRAVQVHEADKEVTKGLTVTEESLQKTFTADDDTTCLYSVNDQPDFQSYQLTTEK